MVIQRSELEINAERPLQRVKKVTDINGNVIDNLYISDDCKFYDIDEYDSHDYFGDCPESDKVNTYIDSHGRI